MGKTNRATAITDMNEHSSRSHALLCVTVNGQNKTTGHRTIGKAKATLCCSTIMISPCFLLVYLIICLYVFCFFVFLL